jgi:hypothetical protein
MDYDTWNMILAKRFSMMYKNYRKFSMRALGKDPLVMTDNQPDLQNTEGAVNVCDQVENPSKD